MRRDICKSSELTAEALSIDGPHCNVLSVLPVPANSRLWVAYCIINGATHLLFICKFKLYLLIFLFFIKYL